MVTGSEFPINRVGAACQLVETLFRDEIQSKFDGAECSGDGVRPGIYINGDGIAPCAPLADAAKVFSMGGLRGFMSDKFPQSNLAAA